MDQKGWCVFHAARARKCNGDPGPAGLKIREKGTGSIHPQGYMTLFVDGKRVLEHRVIMEQILGRKLLPTEEVHHRNGQKADNRPSNLELRSGPHGSGQCVNDLIEYVAEFWLDSLIDAHGDVVVQRLVQRGTIAHPILAGATR